MDCAKPGKYGSACQFDGVDDYVDLGSTPNLNITSAITVTAWVKIPSSAAGSNRTMSIASKSGANGADTFKFYLNSNNSSDPTQLGFWSESASPHNQVSTGHISIGTWQFVAATYDKTNATFYINGARDTQLGMTGGLNSSSNFFSIGKDGGYNSNYFLGSIDDVRIYNYARTPAQIAWDYNKGGPVAEWRFDECQGGTVHETKVAMATTARSIWARRARPPTAPAPRMPTLPGTTAGRAKKTPVSILTDRMIMSQQICLFQHMMVLFLCGLKIQHLGLETFFSDQMQTSGHILKLKPMTAHYISIKEILQYRLAV
jgi:hypothetical protein